MTYRTAPLKFLFGVLSIACILVVSACSPVMIKSDPDTFVFKPNEITKFEKQPNISIENSYSQSKKAIFSKRGRGIEGDFKQYTQTAVDILS